MLFLTYWFVLYAAILFPVYWLLPSPFIRRWVLLAGSVVFHAHFAGPAGVLPIIALGIGTYLAALSRRRWIWGPMIGLNVLALVYYKYAIFLCTRVVGSVWPEAAAAGTGTPFLHNIIPPLAISFFVFEFVHYLIDVGHGSQPIRDPIGFALFAVFWPSIVAGPVKHYQEFLPDVYSGLSSVCSRDVAEGLLRVVFGYAQKAAADTLTAYLTFAEPRFPELRLEWRWFVVACIGMRILLDFSGYSNLAIGFARMHGVKLPENFNWPYLAVSISDFWRRWHMSLSRWIRDYVYIPLGGSRRGPVRVAANGLVTFALCGLWHGAGFNFLVWGVYHGAGLAVAGSYRRWGTPGRWCGSIFTAFPVLGWLVTMVFVFIGWLFFFYPVPTALRMARLLVRGGGVV